ncbi:PH domain-containing protein [Paenibacillus sp. SN-8-1]|uniref:PH domain-containing protein n=1 Tax=Paenibacillus sp. SN-8-1 TaxID=3435409 RepID=UPI003D9AA551
MKFQTRRDPFLSIVIWSSIIILIGSALSPAFVGGLSLIGGVLLFLLCISVAGLIAWLWISTYYIIGENDLFIRTGPATKSIPLGSISIAKPIRSRAASTATSIHRIEIRYDKYEYIQISPLDQEIFLRELKQRCPHLQLK